jgi:hypothetical protein
MIETTADRIVATPRLDVIQDKPMAPKTWLASQEIEARMASYHAANVARGVAEAGMSSEIVANASAVAAREAALLVWPFIANTTFGRVLTVWASLRDGDNANRGSYTIEVAQRMTSLIEPYKLDDFMAWYWRKGKYSLPNHLPGPAPAHQSGTAQSVQKSSNDIPAGPMKTSAD